MKLRVASFDVTPVGGRLRRGVGHRGWLERHGVWLCLRDECGMRGLGEAAPLDPNELAEVRSTLPAAVARILEIDLYRGPRAAVARAVGTAVGEAPLPPSGVWALETALFDLVGRTLNLSVAECLRGAAPSYDDVEVSGLLSCLDGERARSEAEALYRRGIRVLKAKIGAADRRVEATFDALALIRRRLPEMKLRLDANGAWSIDQARASLDVLAELEPELCEQPTAPGQLAGLGATAVPWFADESLDASEDAEAVLRFEAIGGAVIKPPRVGGMLAALEIAQSAQARGLPVIVTHSFDGPIGLAAACELALALPQRPWASGLDRHEALEVFPAADIRQRRVEARVLPTGRPGLGLEMSC